MNQIRGMWKNDSNIYFQTVFVYYTEKKMWHIIALLCIFIHWINIFDVKNANNVFFFSETSYCPLLQLSSFATWRELCKFPVDSQKFPDASTVSSDILEDYKVYRSSKLTFIIFFWFLYSSLGYFVVTAQGENIVKKVGIVISGGYFSSKVPTF